MRSHIPTAATALALVCGGGVACEFRAESAWTSQLSPAGPCWDVNLSDGLAEDSTTELQAMVDCLDKGGLLQPVRPVTDALDAHAPDGEVVGLKLIRQLNNQLREGLDLAIAVQEIACLLYTSPSPRD